MGQTPRCKGCPTSGIWVGKVFIPGVRRERSPWKGPTCEQGSKRLKDESEVPGMIQGMKGRSLHPENREGELGTVWEGLGRDGFRKTVETFNP